MVWAIPAGEYHTAYTCFRRGEIEPHLVNSHGPAIYRVRLPPKAAGMALVDRFPLLWRQVAVCIDHLPHQAGSA